MTTNNLTTLSAQRSVKQRARIALRVVTALAWSFTGLFVTASARAEHIATRTPFTHSNTHPGGRHLVESHAPKSASKAVRMPVDRPTRPAGERAVTKAARPASGRPRNGLRHLVQQPTPSAKRGENQRAKPPAKDTGKRGSTLKNGRPKASGTKRGRRHVPRVDQIDDPVEMKQARVSVPQPAAMASAQTDDPAADYLASIRAQDALKHTVNPAAANLVPAPPTHAEMQRQLAQALQPVSHEQLTEAAVRPILLPGLYRNGRLVVPAPLKGSHDILVHQNLMANEAGLERIQDDDDLRRLRAAHLLVDFPVSTSLHLNPELNEDRRCARPWSVRFATDSAHGFYARFGQALQVNSAVRTVAYQLRLQRVNGNAAAVDGDGASPHLTGQAIDIGKRGMSVAQIAWMRAYLKPLMDAGKIDVEEEFQQACFHISVYRSYLPAGKRKPTRTEMAQLHESPQESQR